MRLPDDMNRTDASAPYTLSTGNFEDFYRVNRAPLARALTLALGDTELALDATAEAMTRTFEQWPTVRGYTNPMGWSYRVGLNWARSRLRKWRRELPPLDGDDSRGVDPLPDTDLDRALARLPLAQRSAVVLRYYLDWQVSDIARALGIRAGTVKSRLHRALAALERDLGGIS